MKRKGNKILSVILMMTIIFSSMSANPNIHADTEGGNIVKESSITENDIKVSMGTTNNTFITYRDPVTGLWSDRMNVSLILNVMKDGIDNLKVELPFDGFKPSLGDDVFSDFTITEDVFSIETPNNPEAKSMVEKFEVDPANEKITIYLKPTKQGVETINLTFLFNENYMAKIPPNQIIWDDLHSQIIDGEGKVVSKSSSINIVSKAENGMSVLFSPMNPVGNIVRGNTAVNRLRFTNGYNLHSLLDESFVNYYYIDIPKTIDSNISSLSVFKDYAQIKDMGTHLRYFVNFEDSKTYFQSWNYSGDPNNNYQQVDLLLSNFDSLNNGESAELKMGIVYRKINGSVKEVSETFTYIKEDLKEFDIFLVKMHNGSSMNVKSIVNTSVPNFVSKDGVFASYSNFGNAATIKNIGSKPIKNVSLNIFQNNTDSLKMNIDRFIVYMSTESSDTIRSQWKIKYEIKNALTNEVRREESDVQTGTNIIVYPPTLLENEFLDKVSLIPMGAEGTSEGVLLPSNGIGFQYFAKNWLSGKWPDGTKIDLNEVHNVVMGGSLDYLDETDASSPVLTEFDLGPYTHKYSPDYAVDAEAFVVSGEAVDRKPGDIVEYQIQGYNGMFSIGNEWKKPIVVVRIPKALEVLDIGELKDFIDDKGVKHSDAVIVELIDSDTTYNYYRFRTTKSGLKNNSNVSFSIPFKIRVPKGTLTGNYAIPAAVISGDSFLQASKSMNSLTDPSKYGFNNDIDKYSVSPSKNTGLSVVPETRLESSSQARANSTDSWSNTIRFGVEKGSSPEMKSVIENSGNSNFTNVRLYNILPYSGDSRGSTGEVQFGGLDSSLGKVYYTTKEVASLPAYNSVDLSSWDNSVLASHGFSENIPTDMSKVTAIYVDYGTYKVKPAEQLETILKFSIPNKDNQVAINQFIFAANEAGTATTMQMSSAKVTFSTEIGQVLYNENKPTTGGTIGSMPDPLLDSTLLDADQKGKLEISSAKPTLIGYTFLYWKDRLNGTTYNPGVEISFDKAIDPITIRDFDATWKANTYTVSYDANNGIGTVASQTFTYDVDSTLAANGFSRVGYTFNGWNTKADGSGTNYNENEVVKNLIDKGEFKLYANWKPNSYLITFNGNSADAGHITPQSMTYDVEKALTVNNFVRKGYTFNGWNTKADGTGTSYTDKEVIKNLVATDGGTIELFAQWTVNTYDVVFNNNGGTGSMANQTLTYIEEKALTANTFTKVGYTFSGWNTEADGSGTTYANQALVKELVATQGGTIELFAQWDMSVTFDILNNKLFVKQGESVNPNWIISNVVPTTNVNNDAYDIVGSLDTTNVGTLNLAIEFEFDGVIFSKSLTLEVKPVLSVKNSDLVINLSDLTEQAVIDTAIPSGWDTRNPLNAVEETVFSIDDLPKASSGKHNVTITSESGETVIVSVTLINDVVTNKLDFIFAEEVYISIHDLKEIDLIKAAGAKGVRQLLNSEGEVLSEEFFEARLVSKKPETVGVYQIDLESDNATATITVTVYDEGKLTIVADDIVVDWSSISNMTEEELAAFILKESNAKVMNEVTGVEYGSTFIEVDIVSLRAVNKAGEYVVNLEYVLHQDTLKSRSINTEQTVFGTSIKLTVRDESVNVPILPGTGLDNTTTIVASALLILGAIILLISRKRTDEE